MKIPDDENEDNEVTFIEVKYNSLETFITTPKFSISLVDLDKLIEVLKEARKMRSE